MFTEKGVVSATCVVETNDILIYCSQEVESARRQMEEVAGFAAQDLNKFYEFMARVAHFNDLEGSLIAQLAAAIGLSKHLFRQSGVAPDIADRSMEVAAGVFAAAIDEHKDARYKVSHRSLALFLVERVAMFGQVDLAYRLSVAESSLIWFNGLTEELVGSYSAEANNLLSLVRAWGCHLAGEIVGDQEFQELDKLVRIENRPQGLYEYLEQHLVLTEEHGLPMGIKKGFNAWQWVLIHSEYQKARLEQFHADQAMQSLNRMLEYNSEYSKQSVIDAAVQGFRDYCAVRSQFLIKIETDLKSSSKANQAVVVA